jgi:multicomponent Na+:H+ antiporter subunit B
VKRALVIALLVIAAIPLLIAVAGLPPHGSLDAPVQTHVSAYYLEHGAEEAGAENIVTDVILNYRGYDTSMEVVVIFTALAAVMATLLGKRTRAVPGSVSEAGVSVVVQFVVRLLAPFIALFAICVILYGHISPGGGFQGGAILGALFIALVFVLGEQRVNTMLPAWPRPWLRAAAPLTFAAVGIFGALLTGYYLGFPTAPDLGSVRTGMLIVIGIGIGVGGAAIIATLFLVMEDE